MEEGTESASSVETVLVIVWPNVEVPAITTKDDGSALAGVVIAVPLLGRLHVTVVRKS